MSTETPAEPQAVHPLLLVMGTAYLLIRTFVLLPFLGLVAAFTLSFGVEDAVARLHYATGSATAPGTVLEIDRGRPVVAFTTPDGTEVTTVARGEHRHGDPLDVTVRYIPERPTEAMLDGSQWIPPILFFLPLVPLLVLLVLRHPRGPRAALYRARLQGLGRTEPGKRVSKRVVLLEVAGALLSGGGLVLILGSLAAFESWRTSDLFPALAVLGCALLPPGLDLLFRGRLFHLSAAPAHPVPEPPKLWSTETYAIAIGLSILVVPVVFLLGRSMLEEDIETPREGAATVLAVGCGGMVDEDAGCDDRGALSYEVDGLTYTSTADLLGLDLEPGDEVRVSWDADDPSLVRVEGPL